MGNLDEACLMAAGSTINVFACREKIKHRKYQMIIMTQSLP